MKIYLAGPMTGIPQYNFPAFDAARDYLAFFTGATVFSPADHDREMGLTGGDDSDGVSQEMLQELIKWDLDRVIESDLIYFLHGWESSKGARVEHALAVFLKKEIRYQDGFPR